VGVEGGPLASGSSGPRGQQLPWGTRCHRAYHERVWSIRPKFKLRHYRKRTSDLRVLMSTRPSALRPCWDRKKPRPRWAGLLSIMPVSRKPSFGKPFTSNGFGNWFRDQCNAAGLPQCSAHGLRKAAARRLAEAGCTAHEIASITGHASLKQVAHYTRAADQERLASAAMEKMKTRTSSG
jgi:integrase